MPGKKVRFRGEIQDTHDSTLAQCRRNTSFIFHMDNLFACICATSSIQKKGGRIPWVILVKDSGIPPLQGVAAFKWNELQDCLGIHSEK
jgi:hypothetical protein